MRGSKIRLPSLDRGGSISSKVIVRRIWGLYVRAFSWAGSISRRIGWSDFLITLISGRFEFEFFVWNILIVGMSLSEEESR